jgi:hypothetical protein
MSYEQSQSGGLGDQIYSGAASFGLIKSLITAIIGTIISVIMIIIGINLMLTKINTTSVEGTILNVRCIPGENNSQNCNINVSYEYNGKQNKNIQYIGNVVYTENQKVTIYINKDNDSEIYLQNPSPKTLGVTLLIIGLLILGGVWLMFWLSKRYKFLAAAEGVSGAYNLFRY